MALKKKHLSYGVIVIIALVIILGIVLAFMTGSGVNYNEQNSNYSRYYVSQNIEECQTLFFQCDSGYEPFFNDRGCGCEPTGEPIEQQLETYCDPDNRPEACTTIYHPVCGYFDQTVNCVTEPCASTFSNNCKACAAENVEFWTDGAC